MNAYFTVDGEPETTLIIERSRFICSMKNVEGENEAREFIEKIRKKYSLANHHCYAYIADEDGRAFRFSDDGEPQGTAGMPMLNVLRGKNFCRTVAVVTRFFGGVKLGTGGLTRAYGNSVTGCIASAKIKHMTPVNYYRLNIDYDGYAKILKAAESKGYIIADAVFNEKAEITLAAEFSEHTDSELKQTLSDIFKGKNVVESQSQGYYDFSERVCRK